MGAICRRLILNGTVGSVGAICHRLRLNGTVVWVLSAIGLYFTTGEKVTRRPLNTCTLEKPLSLLYLCMDWLGSFLFFFNIVTR